MLLHNTDEKYIYKILSDGKLKSSSKTKNIRMYGNQNNNIGSKYIYLRISQSGDYGNLYLDSKLLLENIFYLQLGWHGEVIDKHEKIDGRKLTPKELKNILLKFKKKVKTYYQNQIKNNIPIPLMMSNEILVKNNIDLRKYLKRIHIVDKNKKIIDKINKSFPDVKLI